MIAASSAPAAAAEVAAAGRCRWLLSSLVLLLGLFPVARGGGDAEYSAGVSIIDESEPEVDAWSGEGDWNEIRPGVYADTTYDNYKDNDDTGDETWRSPMFEEEQRQRRSDDVANQQGVYNSDAAYNDARDDNSWHTSMLEKQRARRRAHVAAREPGKNRQFLNVEALRRGVIETGDEPNRQHTDQGRGHGETHDLGSSQRSYRHHVQDSPQQRHHKGLHLTQHHQQRHHEPHHHQQPHGHAEYSEDREQDVIGPIATMNSYTLPMSMKRIRGRPSLWDRARGRVQTRLLETAREAGKHAATAAILAQRANKRIHAYERVVGSMPETMTTLSNAAETLEDQIKQELRASDAKRKAPLEKMMKHRGQHHHFSSQNEPQEDFD